MKPMTAWAILDKRTRQVVINPEGWLDIGAKKWYGLFGPKELSKDEVVVKVRITEVKSVRRK